MLKFLSFVMLFNFAVLSLTAQYKPIIFGLKAAPNIGWMKPDTEGYKSDGVEPGFSWGFIAEFYLMEPYAIQTGFNVIYLNGRMELPYAMDIGNDTIPVTGILNRKYKTQYIELPLVFKMKTELSEKIRLFGKVGLGTGFLLKAKAEDQFTYEDGSKESKTDIKDEVNSVRSSLIIGGGIEYVFKGSTALLLDVTFNNGFTDILKGSNPANPQGDQKAFSNFVELSIGIVF